MENNSLFVQTSGYIEGGDFDVDNLYCRYCFNFGPDWSLIGGVDSGLSQSSMKNAQFDQGIIWNFPIDATFKSTNVHGWPRIALSAYGLDFLGRDVVRGYGSALVPITPGRHVIDIEMYTPLATSAMNQFLSWIIGNPPEFFDSKFVCQSEGREVTRVRRTGSIRIVFNIQTKGFANAGYSY